MPKQTRASAARKLPLKGVRVLVTSGPTYEPLDPVRFLGNRSSGKQGHAIAQALAAAGADVTLVSGPVTLKDPKNVTTVHVETAREMLEACGDALPVDVAICAAAVSDWRARRIAPAKIKKGNTEAPVLELVENPDILKTLSMGKGRPELVIGFAAETEGLLANARAKLHAKRCDWIVANDVSGGKAFNSDDNKVVLVSGDVAEPWPRMTKKAVAKKLTERIYIHLKEKHRGTRSRRSA